MWIGFTQLIRALSSTDCVGQSLGAINSNAGENRRSQLPMGYRRYGHKVAAARIATAVGVSEVITEGRFPGNIEKNLAGEPSVPSLNLNFSQVQLANVGLPTV